MLANWRETLMPCQILFTHIYTGTISHFICQLVWQSLSIFAQYGGLAQGGSKISPNMGKKKKKIKQI